MTERSTLSRALPMLEIAPPAPPSAPRLPDSPDDDRLAEYLPEARTLPRFHVWTLGCQMNRSDSEEMAGRLLTAGCEEADSLETRRPRRHQHLRDPRGRRAEGHRPDGPADPAQGGQPGDARRAHRLLGPRAGPGRAAAPLSGGRSLPAARRGARAHRPARSRLRPGADRGARGDHHGRSHGRRCRRSPGGDPGPCRGRGDRGARVGDRRLAADHLWLRQDVHLLHRAVQPRSGAEPAVRRHPRRGARAGRRRLSRGDAARPERQLVRPRPGARGALRARRRRALGGSPARPGGPAGPRRADPGDRCAADGRRPRRDRAPAVRHLAPVGPVRPAHRGAGRLRRRSASTSTCPSSRARMPSCGGWAASTRSSTTPSA